MEGGARSLNFWFITLRVGPYKGRKKKPIELPPSRDHRLSQAKSINGTRSDTADPMQASCLVTMVTTGALSLSLSLSHLPFCNNTMRKDSIQRIERWIGLEQPPPATLKGVWAEARERASRVYSVCLEFINERCSAELASLLPLGATAGPRLPT